MKGSITRVRHTEGSFVFTLFLLMFWEYFVYERSTYLVMVLARVLTKHVETSVIFPFYIAWFDQSSQRKEPGGEERRKKDGDWYIYP